MFYAYVLENNIYGVTQNWNECKNMVEGRSNAKFKKFNNIKEANAFIEQIIVVERKGFFLKQEEEPENFQDKTAVYFDAGTGRGRGTEVRVSKKNGSSVIGRIDDKKFNDFLKRNNWKINEFENIELGKDYTNNFGELLGLFCALKIAIKFNIKQIFGDSNLVIEYWSKGTCKVKDEKTLLLSNSVTRLREEFEKSGGTISHISGDINPADLGFHR